MRETDRYILQGVEIILFMAFDIPIKFPIIYILIIILNLFFETNFFINLKIYKLNWNDMSELFILICPASITYGSMILFKTVISIFL